MKDRQKEKRMIKDRDEAWTRVESLAMRHPNFSLVVQGNYQNSHNTSGTLDSPPIDEDAENDPTPFTLEKIEARANEVK